MAGLAKVPVWSPDDALKSDKQDHVSDRNDSQGIELDEEGWRPDADEGEEDEDEEEGDSRIDVPNAVVEL